MDGTPFGRYRLIALLGRGGMGEVWRAYDTAIDRMVAIKMLLPDFAKDDSFEQRFRREARAAARLEDPHVVPIHDFGEIDGRLYVTMRLINGVDLQTLLQSGPLETQRAVRIIEQVAKALHAAHRVGLVHRDVKPSNILLDDEDFAYLIDFGIARATGDSGLTSTGATVGTWSYMAPERFSTGRAEPSSDIYALACVLYECLTGQPPFAGASLEQVVVAHLMTPPPQPSIQRRGIPTAMDTVITTGLAKDPHRRYVTTVEMAGAARTAITTPHPVWPTHPAPHPQPMPPPTAPNQFGLVSAPPPGPPPTAPNQFGLVSAPPPGPPPGGQSRAPRHRLMWAGGAALVVLLATVVLVVVFTSRGRQAGGPPPGPTSTASPNTGPFTGVYRADFGPAASHGKPIDGATPSTGLWSVRSACRTTGCNATATATGGSVLQSAFVLDDVGGLWHAVAATSVGALPPGDAAFKDCPSPGEYWTVITLQPRGDGTLAGQYRVMSEPRCEIERTVTFSRTGDVDVDSLPDPAGQSPRAASGAEAFHGRYRETKAPDGRSPTVSDVSVQTDCLRTGERCISDVASNQIAWRMLIFANGKWTYNFVGKGTCTAGGTDQVKVSWNLPLPQPPQNPITLLTGQGNENRTGTTCAGSFSEALKYERTGD